MARAVVVQIHCLGGRRAVGCVKKQVVVQQRIQALAIAGLDSVQKAIFAGNHLVFGGISHAFSPLKHPREIRGRILLLGEELIAAAPVLVDLPARPVRGSAAHDS